MLNAVLQNQLHRPIKKVTFLEQPKTKSSIATTKQRSMKVRVWESMGEYGEESFEDQDGCKYIIEMQVADKEGRGIFFRIPGFEKRVPILCQQSIHQPSKSWVCSNP